MYGKILLYEIQIYNFDLYRPFLDARKALAA